MIDNNMDIDEIRIRMTFMNYVSVLKTWKYV